MVVLGHGTLQAAAKPPVRLVKARIFLRSMMGSSSSGWPTIAFRSQGNTMDHVCREGQVGMEIDDRVFGSRHLRLFHVEHAYRLMDRQGSGSFWLSACVLSAGESLVDSAPNTRRRPPDKIPIPVVANRLRRLIQPILAILSTMESPMVIVSSANLKDIPGRKPQSSSCRASTGFSLALSNGLPSGHIYRRITCPPTAHMIIGSRSWLINQALWRSPAIPLPLRTPSLMDKSLEILALSGSGFRLTD